MNPIRIHAVVMFTALALLSCAGEQPYDPLKDYEQLNITTVIAGLRCLSHGRRV
jgi:hypothetical protein